MKIGTAVTSLPLSTLHVIMLTHGQTKWNDVTVAGLRVAAFFESVAVKTNIRRGGLIFPIALILPQVK